MRSREATSTTSPATSAQDDARRQAEATSTRRVPNTALEGGGKVAGWDWGALWVHGDEGH